MTHGAGDNLGGRNDPPAREPLFNAPWPATALILVLAIAFGLQALLLTEAGVYSLALTPMGLRSGMWWTLFSYMFLHSGWAHILMNAGSALAFAPPVARLLGGQGRGAVVFFGFYLLCGVLAGLGFCLLHWQGSGPVIGASGAVSGLWGAASRLLAGRGLAPALSRPVLTQAAVFAGINVLLGVLGVFGGLNIAWEAHLIGYAAGLALIGPAARLARSRDKYLPADRN